MASAKRARTQDLQILNAIAEALNSAPDVRQALERTLSLVAERLGLQTGWVWLLDAETQQFYNAAAQALPPYLQEPVRMTGRSCRCLDDFREGKLTPQNMDVVECSRLWSAVQADDLDATRGLRFHASIPLYFQDKPLGIMNVTGPEWREIAPEELRLLSTIAYQVGIAIERARLAEAGARLARVEERERLAREIHDTLAQGLTAIGLQLESALGHLETNPQRTRERLQRALILTRESLEEARRSVLNLRAMPLEGKTLLEALAGLARTFTSETGVRVQTQLECSRLLPIQVEAELFRIAQEALTNIQRHSSAREATVAVRSMGAHVHLSIKDKGQGFDPPSVPADRQGLIGMRERARLIGGHLRIVSSPGKGTTISVRIPLPQERPS